MEEQQKPAGNKITILLWIIAFIITAFSAYYQRVTGPTYPVSGSVIFQGKEIFYTLDRSSSSSENCTIKLQTTDDKLQGVILWKRFKTNDELSRAEMKNENGVLTGEVPKQPPSGKLQYYIRIIGNNTETNIPKDNPVTIRFKGDIPLPILLLHVIFMFAAMLVSTRAGMEIFRKEPKFKKLAFWTIGLLTIGGMLLGPLVQNYAFGQYWTGVPFGFDLTDNKTLIAWLGWIVATVMIFKSKKPKYWVIGAAVLLLVVFLIPHSVLGSEIDYSKM